MRVEKGLPVPNSYNDDKLVFTAVFSTKRLLQNALNAEILQADGTYKLNWQNYPLLVFGTSDKQRKCHIIALAMTSHETADAYQFCFETIKNNTVKFFNQNIPFKCLLSDTDRVIKVAFKIVFPNTIELVCWFHVLKNLEKRLKTSANKKTILDDLKKLQ